MNEVKKKEIVEYCYDSLEQMWSARIVGILLECDFRDAKQYADKYLGRPKKMVKKTMWRLAIHEFGGYKWLSDKLYETQESAMKETGAFTAFEVEVEVEVEE